MNSLTSFLLLLVLLSTTTLSIASRPESSGYFSGKSNKGGNGGFFGNIPGGGGFGIPGFGNGWGNGGGYGGGYGSPKGGHNRNGVITPYIVCQQKGPCYMKKFLQSVSILLVTLVKDMVVVVEVVDAQWTVRRDASLTAVLN